MNKRVLVTGASHGIGQATARLLAEEGAQLLIHGRDEAALRELQSELGTATQPVSVCAVDFTEPDFAPKLAEAARANLGQVDVLINNVGGGVAKQPFHTLPNEQVSRIFRLNLESVFALTQHIIPLMLAHGGRIVNVASLAGRRSSPLASADYAAAKAGLIGLTRQLAVEYAPHNICVNAVAPGITRTKRVGGRWDSRDEADRESLLQGIPLHRIAEVNEVALPILFLASDDASYITGHTLDVNGGTFMN